MRRSDRNFKTLPDGNLGIIAMESCKSLGNLIDKYITGWRGDEAPRYQNMPGYDEYYKESYLLDAGCPRFGSGEAKGIIRESVRGTDLYILVDVLNYSIKYSLCGHQNSMSPDDHFQDLKRLIAASGSKAKRISVIMPFLYESRQHKRSTRESLDCAMMLQELIHLGVQNIITFDAHDPRVQNAIPNSGFDTVQPTYQFVKSLVEQCDGVNFDSDHLMVISPDEGAMNRAVYLANNLGVDMGMFYKRRDYSKVVNGRNPIVAHEFLGSSVEGKTVLIIDDMISSGESMLDTCKELKERKAAKAIVCCTFGLFTNGLEKFDEYYEKGYLDYVITTNLNYRPKELFDRKWYLEADMSKYTAAIINSLNHDRSISASLSPTDKIQKLVQRRHNGEI